LHRVDPVGFEPTIFSLQRRRLPARPRALPGHTLLLQNPVPTRGLEPPHLAVIDPKSIASASSATSAFLQRTREYYSARCCQRANPGQCVLPILSTTCASAPACAVIYLNPGLPLGLAAAWPAGCCPTHLLRCGEIQLHCSRTHSPCSQLHARLAGHIAVAAGRLLPYPFTPGRLAPVGSALCCGCSHVAIAGHGRPHLLFREATPWPGCPSQAGSREVPLPKYIDSDGAIPPCIQLLTCSTAPVQHPLHHMTFRNKKCIIALLTCQIRGVFPVDA
jgi:hypothetical protein